MLRPARQNANLAVGHFEADPTNASGEAVARVTKEVYVRAKEPA